MIMELVPFDVMAVIKLTVVVSMHIIRSEFDCSTKASELAVEDPGLVDVHVEGKCDTVVPKTGIINNIMICQIATSTISWYLACMCDVKLADSIHCN